MQDRAEEERKMKQAAAERLVRRHREMAFAVIETKEQRTIRRRREMAAMIQAVKEDIASCFSAEAIAMMVEADDIDVYVDFVLDLLEYQSLLKV